MATWRSPELEEIIGCQIDVSLSELVIDRLVSDAVRKTEQLDFKGPMAYAAVKGQRPPWTKEQEFAKDDAASAGLH